MRRGTRRCVISHHAVKCTDKGPLDTQPPPEKLDDCMRRYRASQASKTSIPIKAARVTIAHRCSESRGHSTTPSSTSFGPLSRPPPSSANHRPSPPTQTREAQHCRIPRTSLQPLFLRFCLWLASTGCTFQENIPLPVPFARPFAACWTWVAMCASSVRVAKSWRDGGEASWWATLSQLRSDIVISRDLNLQALPDSRLRFNDRQSWQRFRGPING